MIVEVRMCPDSGDCDLVTRGDNPDILSLCGVCPVTRGPSVNKYFIIGCFLRTSSDLLVQIKVKIFQMF